MIFETKRLILRPWREEDAEDLYLYASDPEVGPPAGWQPHTSVENSREIIRTVLSAHETYAICLKEDGRAIGSIGFHRNDLAVLSDEYELGYWIGKPFWGRGLVPEASQELLRYAFEDLHMERIWCGYYDGNHKSRRVQEKLGFVYHHTTEGIEVKLMGEIRTGHAMLMTKERWQRQKEEERMQEIILGKLREIEECENVKILHAVESGSRAWGFASPDSDYDVRFIYVRPMEYYLRLDKTRDVIEWQLDDTLDINGWDIRKALILLHKSNPTLFEWNTSPIVYKTTDVWQKLSDFIGQCFLKKSGLYHYLNTARSNYHEFLKGDTVRLKKYFYVLRPILACKWILEKGTPPPMEFHILMEEQLEAGMRPIVKKLLDMKMNAPEIMTDRPIVALNEYLLGAIAEVEEAIATLPTEEGNAYDELNELFLKVLGEIW